MIILTFEGFINGKLVLTNYKTEEIELDNLFNSSSDEIFWDWLMDCYDAERSLKDNVKLKAVEIYP